MIVDLNGHKYDVAFGDPDVLEAINSGAAEISTARQNNKYSVDGMCRAIITACSRCVDNAVGFGAAVECLGDKPMYDESLVVFATLMAGAKDMCNNANAKIDAIMGSGAPELPAAPVTQTKPSNPVRLPVRVE